MTVEFFSAIDTGRARTNNEDAVALDEPAALAVLADGMGGYNAGEVASQMATSFIRAELGRWLVEAGDDEAAQQRGVHRRLRQAHARPEPRVQRLQVVRQHEGQQVGQRADAGRRVGRLLGVDLHGCTRSFRSHPAGV
jgi:hypothetical protein